jgi:hypothetical protein
MTVAEPRCGPDGVDGRSKATLVPNGTGEPKRRTRCPVRTQPERDAGLLRVGFVTASLTMLRHRIAPYSCPTRKTPSVAAHEGYGSGP